uniref:Uncharacterized protein n=1 Tax=Oryza punctata TaxID=4537 RepID=A0A0E0JHF3_ORYPU
MDKTTEMINNYACTTTTLARPVRRWLIFSTYSAATDLATKTTSPPTPAPCDEDGNEDEEDQRRDSSSDR